MSPTIQTTLERCRSLGSLDFVDRSGQFTPAETEALRRVLRAERLNGNRAVCGEWRKGYELILGGERLGVTNGYGRFRVYYRNSQTSVIPSDVSFESETTDDDLALFYGLIPNGDPDDYAIQAYN